MSRLKARTRTWLVRVGTATESTTSSPGCSVRDRTDISIDGGGTASDARRPAIANRISNTAPVIRNVRKPFARQRSARLSASIVALVASERRRHVAVPGADAVVRAGDPHADGVVLAVGAARRAVAEDVLAVQLFGDAGRRLVQL